MNKILKIKRENQSVSGISKMKVYINDKKLGVLSNNEEKSFSYSKKENNLLIVRCLWFKSVFDLTELEKKNSLQISFAMSNKQFLFFGLAINILTILYFILKIKVVFYLTLISVSYFIYFLALKRNRIIIEPY